MAVEKGSTEEVAECPPPTAKLLAQETGEDVAVVIPSNEGHARKPKRQQSSVALTLAWHSVNISTKTRASGAKCFGLIGKKENIPSKKILRNVAGIVRPGELVAIMGASGAGKTTLMNFLTSRNLNRSTLDIEGTISVNGVTIKASKLSAMSAYVQQEDLFIGTLTVKEHLKFQALLKMDKSLTFAEKMARVDEVMTELGLKKCANTVIGVPGRVKGISGGEQKRLAFASEILTDPPLMFCDEPTSGLDSFMAQNVVGVLKGMAEKGKAIISTIHQPSSEVYAMFSRILLMAEGRVAYLGDVEGAFEFFKEQGYEVPRNYNPPDYFMQVLALRRDDEAGSRKRMAEICDAYESSNTGREVKEASESVSDAKNDSSTAEFLQQVEDFGTYRTNWWSQFGAVFRRSIKSILREPLIIKVRIMQTIVVSLLLGVIYLKQELDQEGIQNINGALFLILTNMTFQNAFAVINVFTAELPIFMREHLNGLYRVDVYFISKILAELPLFILYSTAFVTVIYWMSGLNDGFDRFLICVLIVNIVAQAACSFGYLMSSVSSSATMALSLGPPLIVPLLLFGGLFLNNDSIPVYFIWLKYISWFYYGNEALIVNQWEGVKNITCPGVGPCVDSGDMVIESLNFDPDNLWPNIGFLAALAIGYRLAAFAALQIRTSRKR